MASQIREYSIQEIRQEMKKLRESSNLVQLVNAEECRILNLQEDEISYGPECHSV